jgi:hypothetical protein
VAYAATFVTNTGGVKTVQVSKGKDLTQTWLVTSLVALYEQKTHA